MSFTVIIPARYASTRLPAKPLADICGVPSVAEHATRDFCPCAWTRTAPRPRRRRDNNSGRIRLDRFGRVRPVVCGNPDIGGGTDGVGRSPRPGKTQTG